MGEIRGEKVSFRKQDIVALHDLPSSRIANPLIVHCPRPASFLRRFVKVAMAVAVLALVCAGGLVFAVENGAFDRLLSDQARSALDNAAGPRYRAEVGSTVIRFTRDMQLALEARDVNMLDRTSGRHLSRTGSIRLALDPLALFSGHVAIGTIEAEGIALDTALLSTGGPIDLTTFRVDQIPGALESAFQDLDFLLGLVNKSQTRAVRVEDLDLIFPVVKGKPLSVAIKDLALERNDDGSLTLGGMVAIDGAVARLDVKAQSRDDRTVSLTAGLYGAAVTPFFLKRDQAGVAREGLEGLADITVSAGRAGETGRPEIAIGLGLKQATFYVDGIAQELSRAKIEAAYDFGKNSLEFQRSLLQFANTSMPFTGAVIDLDRLDPQAAAGFGLDFLVRDGVAAPEGTGEAPLAFETKATGRFVTAAGELQLDHLAVSSPLGAMVGSLNARFGEGSPQISFGSQARTLQTAAVKQLWPFWMAPKARQWVLANLYGGTVTNASIAVFIPAGRMPPGGGSLHLDENELRIGFDIDNARMNIAGDIPPIRDTAAHFDLKGPRMVVDIKSGTSYFTSGRSVMLEGGDFVIPATYDKPLMAEMNITVSGSADAVAELVTYRPITGLQRTGFVPTDFKGAIRANVVARVGLISAHKPPPPEWKATMELAGVDVVKEISGRKVAGLNGTLDIDPQRAVLKADGRIDDVPVNIQLTEPVDSDSPVGRQRVINATLDNDQREKLAPGLGDILNGPVKVEFSRIDDKRQAVSVDLSRATIAVPWLGWTKGSGIAAKAGFELTAEGKDVTIRDFEIAGASFGARGNLVFGKNGLVSADFSRVRLASADNYAMKIDRTKSGYDIFVNGKTADLRSVISRLHALRDGAGRQSGKASAVTVRAKLDQVTGFNDETLSSVNLLYANNGTKIDTLDFSAVTRSGQAVVGQKAMGSDGDFIQVTSGDAGAVARFADLYRRMNGGLLNVRMREGRGGWSGNIDIRNFGLANEKALQSIVSTPVGEDGRSLNKAVKRNIDVSSERFQRAFARLIMQDGVLKLENGILRGEQVGATFQGLLRDAKGNMDMTGTFMPAYGLNRLFAELPVIGILLGNGRDRGLLGITFRLQGDFDQPKMTFNPLSIIAPGVFRQIFEF